MAPSSSSERTLAVLLRLVGNGLLNAPSSVDRLLTLLDLAENLLANMEQEPSDFLQDALLPVMRGLITESLFKHSNEDVRVTVASCLSEIMRITLPAQPFNDDQMKAIFQLIVEALSKLSQSSTPSYGKALSVLQTIARVKACLLMLDLECEALVLQMCQLFWVIIRYNPSADAYWAVEQIMTDILTESEDISPDLVIPLLASVLKENEKVAPSCWKLGEKLFSNCAAKLRPVLWGALELKGTTLDDYSPVVASMYQNDTSVGRSHLSAMPAVSSKKRRNALKSDVETVRDEAALVPNDLRDKKMKLPTKGQSDPSKGTSGKSGGLSKGLVGRRIKVWWPLDEMFYDGLIQSYNSITKKHKVLYDDGDTETLNLEKEQWEFIENDSPAEEANNPKPITSPVILRKKNGNGKSSQSTRIRNFEENGQSSHHIARS